MFLLAYGYLLLADKETAGFRQLFFCRGLLAACLRIGQLQEASNQ